MQVKDIMTKDPMVFDPGTALVEAARYMRDMDTGVVPIGENDRLVGMLTDRDITTRAAAEGRDPNSCTLRDVMTKDVVYCYEDDDVHACANKMEDRQIRRLVVLNRDKRLVGIVSLGDLAVEGRDTQLTGEVTEKVSEHVRTQPQA